MNPLQSSPKGMTRSPTGCNAKPIHLGTRPAEREKILSIAKKLRLSIGGTARLLVLLGLERVEAGGLDELFRINELDLKHNPRPRTRNAITSETLSLRQ